MAVPKRRKSRSKRDSRRANHKISAKVYNTCAPSAHRQKSRIESVRLVAGIKTAMRLRW